MSQVKERSEISDNYKWNLGDIYANQEEWDKDYQLVKNGISEIVSYQSKLSESAEKLLSALKLSNDIEIKAEKLYVYSRMKRDEDNTLSEYQAQFDRAEAISIEYSTASAFLLPELSALDKSVLEEYMQQNQDLVLYKHFFDEILRQKKHILSSEEERLLAMAADISMASQHIYGMLNNADIKFPTIKDENGKDIEITKGRFGSLMESSDRRVRKDAFQGLYSSYTQLKNTLTTTLSSSVKKDIFQARVRKYPSALEAALDQDNVSISVYNKLIESVHKNLEPMYRYMKLRKQVLQVDEMHMYDIYTPLIKEYKMEIPYEKAQEMVVDGLSILGDEYINTVKKGLESAWIDVYENKGKTGGAYSWGSYETNPYILLNYDNKINDVFTLAHELGHSMHSYYSNKNQPYVYSQYSIFLAEVASTVNESLLMDYLIAKSQDKKEKAFLINYYLEQFRGTVYRQTMFAEFEKIIHEEVEKGGALTPEYLSQSYRDLNRLYYGPDMILDEEISWEWSRIPHFYSAFYVYKYATGFSAATSLKKEIIEQGQNAVDRYIDFLSAGNSDYPLKVLQRAGVDLTTAEPVDETLKQFALLVDQLEELL